MDSAQSASSSRVAALKKYVDNFHTKKIQQSAFEITLSLFLEITGAHSLIDGDSISYADYVVLQSPGMAFYLFCDSVHHFFEQRLFSTLTVISQHLIQYRPTQAKPVVSQEVKKNRTLIQALATASYYTLFEEKDLFVIKGFEKPDIERFFLRYRDCGKPLLFFAGRNSSKIRDILKATLNCADFDEVPTMVTEKDYKHVLHRAVWSK